MENISNAHKFIKRRQIKNRRVGEFWWLLYGRLNHPRTTAPKLTQLQPRDRTAISLKSREDADAALFARTFWRYYDSFIQRFMENSFSRREEKSQIYLCLHLIHLSSPIKLGIYSRTASSSELCISDCYFTWMRLQVRDFAFPFGGEQEFSLRDLISPSLNVARRERRWRYERGGKVSGGKWRKRFSCEFGASFIIIARCHSLSVRVVE